MKDVKKFVKNYGQFYKYCFKMNIKDEVFLI